MGVTGLWTVVAPTARPTSLASLNRKRLAVDASIWIYQFLKAVRDKEGNALRNSHVIGFFRRICKLLYFGIKPVFVFDGGAPALKRETVRKRRGRREGRREDAVRTAAKLMAVQMERAAEDEDRKRKAGNREVEEELPEDSELVYVDEIGMGEQERKTKRGEGFKRKDQYHLPDLDVSISELGAPNDPRIMSQAELEEYARQFHSGEDLNLYDFSKIDFESPFFMSLPPGDRYNILNAARLRSRLRMGYSKEQLDGMFPDRMAFSRFQIERVRERNELTQRLMHINGGNEFDIDQGGRIAGEKGKEYVLVRNEGVEGGWALGVVSNREGTKAENAIDLDAESDKFSEKAESEEDEEFEDVAVEGLNRLPQTWKRKRQQKEVDYDVSYEDAAAVIAKKRKAVYGAREEAAQAKVIGQSAANGDLQEDSLFVPQDGGAAPDDNEDDLFEDVNIEAQPAGEEDDDLQRAIAMSMEKPEEARPEEQQNDAMLIDGDEEEGLDMQAALAESRKSKYQPKTNARAPSPKPAASASNFSGPLPFESLNLGQSLLGKKKSKKVEEDLSGGFDREQGEDAFRKERPPQPMPEWFNATPSIQDFRKGQGEQQRLDPDPDRITYSQEKRSTLRRHQTNEVIDLEAEGTQKTADEGIHISSDEEAYAGPSQEQEQIQERHEWEMPKEVEDLPNAQEEQRKKADDEAREERYRLAREIAAENEPKEQSMDQLAERTRAEPPHPTDLPASIPSPKQAKSLTEKVKPVHTPPFDDASEDEGVDWSASEDDKQREDQNVKAGSEDEGFDWSESEADQNAVNQEADAAETPANEAPVPEEDDEDFEDVAMPDEPPPPPTLQHQPSTGEAMKQALANPYLMDSDTEDDTAGPSANGEPNNQPTNQEEEYFSDSDEELMRQLAIEAEEHARFASSLNNTTGTKDAAQAARDYESELKNLRNQQKKDRRDADEVTQTMIQECQALLRLFGLPYITAPMEAEAQCAELVHLGLVDGIVTDDSDIFLFGGTRIYKNMFNAAKFVECYLTSDLEKEYALDRKKLIRFAHLLGSDYTEGIPGVGPVTALEILTDFADLQEFKIWCENIQLGKKMDGQLGTAFRRKFRNAALKRVFLPTGFPDLRVDAAYLKPEVDNDPAEFQWGVPDLDKLRSFLMATIGWGQERTDEVLVPVIRDMNKRELEGTQANITRFFGGGVGVGAKAKAHIEGKDGVGGAGVSGRDGIVDNGAEAGQRNRTGKESGRMRNAYKRLRGEAERRKEREVDGADGTQGELDDSEPQELVGENETAVKTNGKVKKTRAKRKPSARNNDDENDEADDDENYKPTTKTARKRRAGRKAVIADA